MATTAPMYDVPPLRVPFALTGARGVTLTLEEFAPTNIDAWYATATVGGRTVPAVVVRHAGDVARRRLLGRRVAAPVPPAGETLLAVVVEAGGPALRFVAPRDPARLALELSRAEWRAFLD